MSTRSMVGLSLLTSLTLAALLAGCTGTETDSEEQGDESQESRTIDPQSGKKQNKNMALSTGKPVVKLEASAEPGPEPWEPREDLKGR